MFICRHLFISFAQEMTFKIHMVYTYIFTADLLDVQLGFQVYNIIASERSGVECARDEIYAHCEITITRI